MRKRFLLRAGAAALAVAWLVQPPVVQACAVCYGEPDSPASRGLTWAIVALAGIVACVLAGIVGFFVQANRKSLDGAGLPPELER